MHLMNWLSASVSTSVRGEGLSFRVQSIQLCVNVKPRRKDISIDLRGAIVAAHQPMKGYEAIFKQNLSSLFYSPTATFGWSLIHYGSSQWVAMHVWFGRFFYSRFPSWRSHKGICISSWDRTWDFLFVSKMWNSLHCSESEKRLFTSEKC